ncbi:hypothetical protein [Sphaerotilus microaerophilus]|uniref:Uncharacterized protein n=1 Tax=Sphaerotilus microaerophilus TaxID=2914710 RepID=A0ABN6PIW7_9BURK|nr:hypothetical protein [Sphaerotilus sp. FB-5]BDI04994.1 hypothetical protein CATMQ487_19640 [Sphaerotilus sp. FB-5]
MRVNPTRLRHTALWQSLARTLGVVVAVSLSWPAEALPCPGPALRIEAVAPGVWWIPGAAGEANAANRGAISNALAVRDGPRLWLLGSGPTAAHGRALGCRLRRLTGRPVSDVIAPWARPELVLGQAGLRAPRHWAHADVASAMRERCTRCIERLRRRLGEAASDLETAKAPIPQRLLQGAAGRLGPWRWWRLDRGADTAVTVWWLPRAGLASAHGLLWADGAPDLRDSVVSRFAHSLRALGDLERDTLLASHRTGRMGSAGRAADTPTVTLRWLPEQGGWLTAGAPGRELAHVQALQQAVQAAIARGAVETDPPPPLAAVWPDAPPPDGSDLRQGLNWQRAWREAEQDSFAPAAR